jgi:hypothetical protein
MGWATFLALFSQNHLVTLLGGRSTEDLSSEKSDEGFFRRI